MIRPVTVATAAGERTLAEWGSPLPLTRLLPGAGAWELEIGFGKGRYLVGRATAEPDRRFLGIEVAREGDRDTAVRAALGEWVRVLERAVRAHPTQWYTFYDFWHPPATKAPGSDRAGAVPTLSLIHISEPTRPY